MAATPDPCRELADSDLDLIARLHAVADPAGVPWHVVAELVAVVRGARPVGREPTVTVDGWRLELAPGRPVLVEGVPGAGDRVTVWLPCERDAPLHAYLKAAAEVLVLVAAVSDAGPVIACAGWGRLLMRALELEAGRSLARWTLMVQSPPTTRGDATPEEKPDVQTPAP